MLEGEAKPAAAPQITWELAGESFLHPVIAAPAGAEISIKNTSRTARARSPLFFEDAKLIPSGPINPGGPRSFRVLEAGKAVYNVQLTPIRRTCTARSSSSARRTPRHVDDSGNFELADVPPGEYKARVFYRDGWIERVDDTVTVTAKGKVDINPKIPAGYPVAGAKK